MLIKSIFTFFSLLSSRLPTQTPMKRLPLTPLNILNHAKLTFESLPLQNKLSKNPNTTSEKNLLVKTENSHEADIFDNSISFHNLQPAAGEESSRTNGDFLNDSPRTQSSSTKSSLQKKSIKKPHTESEKKLKARFRQREKRPTKGAKAAEISRQSSSSPLHLPYNFTPKKFLSQLMSQEEETPEIKESVFASTSTRNETDSKKTGDKNIFCLNLMPNDAKMEISGISVFIGDEYDEVFNFSTETKTIKYIV